MSVKHSKTSTKADGSDTSQVRPSDWNDNHVVDTGPCLLGNTASSSSSVQNITLGSNLSFSGSTLVASGGVATSGSVSAGQLAVFTSSSTISGYTTSGYVKLTTTGIVSTSSTIPFTSVTGFYYNAQAYGVTGGASVDNAAAINSLISTVSSAGGGTIYFPAGDYLVNSTVSNRGDYVTLMGDSFGNTRIFTTDTTVTVFEVGTMSTVTKIKNPGIKNLNIQAATGATTTSVFAVKMYGVTQPEIYSSQFNYGGSVFYLKNCDLFNFMHSQFVASTSTTYVGNWVQGVVDDVTIGDINTCYFNTKADGQATLLFDAEAVGANEFNRLHFHSCKFGGTSGLSGNTGISFYAGVRGTGFYNCAFQYNTGAQFDFSALDPTGSGYKNFITIDECSLIGTSGTKVNHVINTATSSTANNNIYIEMRNCSIQNTTSVFTQTVSGSPNIIITNLDLSVIDCFLNTQSGTPRITMLGPQRWGASVTTTISGSGVPVICQLNGGKGSFITKQTGTGTMPSGVTNTAVTFTTALDVTPSNYDVCVNFTGDPGTSMGSVWVTNVTTTGFTLKVKVAPTSNSNFAYKVDIT